MEELIGAISGITGNQARYLEAARAMVEHKLTERMVAKMEQLECASKRLGWIGVAVAVVGVILTVVQVMGGCKT